MLLGTVTPVLEQWCAACLVSVLIPGNSQQLLRTALHLWEDAWRLAGEASWGNTGFPTVALLEIQHFILIYWWYLPSLKIQMFYMPKPLDKRADSRDREWNAGLPPLGWVSARCVCVQTFCLQDGPLKFPTSCISFSRRDQERWSGCWSECSVGEVLGWVLETMESIAPALQVRQSASFKHLTPHQYPCRMKGPGLSTAGPNPSDEHTCIHVSLSWEVGGEVLSVPERAVPASQASCGPGMGNGGACGILGAAGRQNVRKWALHVSAVCVMRLLWWFLEALVALFSLNLGFSSCCSSSVSAHLIKISSALWNLITDRTTGGGCTDVKATQFISDTHSITGMVQPEFGLTFFQLLVVVKRDFTWKDWQIVLEWVDLSVQCPVVQGAEMFMSCFDRKAWGCECESCNAVPNTWVKFIVPVAIIVC